MRSKCINSTSGHKSVTGNKFSNIDSLYDVEIYAVQCCFLSNMAIFHCSFGHITTSGLKSDAIFESARPFPIKTRSFPACDPLFGDFRDDVCTCAVSGLILLPVIIILTENGFSDIDFLQQSNFSCPTPPFAYFGAFSLRMRSFDHIATSGLKYDVIFEFSMRIFL